MNKIYSKDGRLLEIKKDGERIWTEENTLRRPKISEQSKNGLVKEIQQIEDEHAKKTCEKMFEILTGETVEETQKK